MSNEYIEVSNNSIFNNKRFYLHKRRLYNPVPGLSDSVFSGVRKLLNNKSPVEFFLKSDKIDGDDRLSKLFFNEPGKDLLVKKISKDRESSFLNYKNDIVFASYDTAYFYRNFYKSLIMMSYLTEYFPDLFKTNDVIDIGSGSGTAAISWFLTLEREITLGKKLNHNQCDVRYSFLDNSEFQLRICSKLSQKLNMDRLNINLLHADFTDFLQVPMTTFRLCNYVICSLKDFSFYKSTKIKNMLGNTCIIMDYDTIIMQLAQQLSDIGYECIVTQLKSKVPSNFLTSVKSPTINVNFLLASLK